LPAIREGKLRPEHPAYYPNSIYLFTGRESSVYAKHNEIHAIRSILKNGPSPTDVHNFNSLRVSALRAVAWDKAAHVVVFPSFAEYPDLHMISKTDIKVGPRFRPFGSHCSLRGMARQAHMRRALKQIRQQQHAQGKEEKKMMNIRSAMSCSSHLSQQRRAPKFDF
jgi:hypothetical protein